MLVTLRLNSCANFSFVVCLWPGCLLKSSDASSSFSWKHHFSSARNRQCSRLRRTSSGFISASRWRIGVSSLPVALTQKPTVSSTQAAASWPRATDHDRPPRPAPFCLFWLVAAGATLSSCIIVAWWCEPPAPMLGEPMCSASSSSPGGWSHTACQLCRQRRCTPHLLRHSVRFLLVPFLSPHVSSPGSSCSIPHLDSTMVADDLRPCVSADHEHLSALHDAGVDEDDFARQGFATAEALVKQPLVNSQLQTLVLFVSVS